MSGTIIFRFDDGNPSVWDYAMPILAQYGLAGTAFVGGDFMPQMRVRQMQDLYDAGWDIANHTQGHYYLTTLSQAAAQAEIEAMTAWILDHGWTRGAHLLAYPFDAVNETVFAATADAGIVASTGGGYGYNTPPITNWYGLKYQYFMASYPVAEIYGYIDAANAASSVLILTGHSLKSSGAAGIEYPVDAFSFVVSYAAASGARIVTLSQWVAEQQRTPWSYGGKPPSRGASASATEFGSWR